jgi:hypothetical protein
LRRLQDRGTEATAILLQAAQNTSQQVNAVTTAIGMPAELACQRVGQIAPASVTGATRTIAPSGRASHQ